MTWGQGKIWYDGALVDWEQATCHVLSHALHYGSSVFEGIRCYQIDGQPHVFRMHEHVRRLFDSAKIYRIQVPYTADDFKEAIQAVIRENGLKSCYVRPLIFQGLKSLSVNPAQCPVRCVVAAWAWGSYLGEGSMEKGVSVSVSSWRRPAPDTLPSMAKAGGNYLNSQLMIMEATHIGTHEAIALDYAGFVSEGSGENVFLVRDGVIHTPPLSASILPGITRDCVLTLARTLDIPVREESIPREALYLADEIFFSGTAAEIVPVTRVDGLPVGEGARGPITAKIQSAFFEMLSGKQGDPHNWLTPVPPATQSGPSESAS